MSKTVLFYFTGTGNSLAVTQKLARDLEDAKVISMLDKDAHTYITKNTENIGLIYPIHMNAIPKVVTRFIEKLEGMSYPYIFAIATNGGIPGMSGVYLNRILNKHMIELDDYFEIEMINNTPKGVAPRPLMRLNWELEITKEKTESMLKKVDVEIENIKNRILNKERNAMNVLSSKGKVFNLYLMKLLWYISEKSNPKLDFILDDDCIGCGTCEAVCTTGRIKVNNGKPQWIKEECNFCYACFNYCPEQAIGVKYYIKKLGRYHHPNISSDDIAKQFKK